MNNNKINLTDKDQMIYIPAYVEQGTEILIDVNDVLEDIAKEIDRGVRKIKNSGYEGGIPYIEKGGEVSNALGWIEYTIKIISNELEKYSKGKNILPDNAIIIADEETIEKYKIAKERVYCSLEEYKNAPRISPKWDKDYLTAAAGSICYYGKDGRYTKETWCDLDPSYLVTLMREKGYDLDFWIREDGVYMYGDYVMVAADISGMDGSRQSAEYRKGDLVETSLGTGMVVDYCGMAVAVGDGAFKGGRFGDIDVWYDIYTAWHDGGIYQEIGYRDPSNSSGRGTKSLIRAGREPSALYHGTVPQIAAVPVTTQSNPISSATLVLPPAIMKPTLLNKLEDLTDPITSLFTQSTSIKQSAGTNKEVNPIPILISLGLSTAAGVGSKFYLENKDNKKTIGEKGKKREC